LWSSGSTVGAIDKRIANRQYRLLGPLEVFRDGEPLDLGGPKQRALLAILLIEPDRVVTTDKLIENLWPDRAPGKPETAIQGYVSQLRKVLEPERASGTPFEVLVTDPSGYRMHIEPDSLDTELFVRLLDAGRAALARKHPREASMQFTKALDLWHGSPLAEFGELPWAASERTRLEELRLLCLEEQIEAELDLGRHNEVIGDLASLIGREPLRERPRGQLMRALYRAGRQADALDAYHQARKTLSEELGIDPSPELQALEIAILKQDPALIAAANEPAVLPTNLPAPANALVGRERELAALEPLLTRADVRLVTITGPGGIGKTRFALECAVRVRSRFPDGSWWVRLEAIRDERLVLPAVAQVLSGGNDPATQIGDQRILLVLDNLEQVLAVGPEIARLLSECPNLTVLATSREPLHVSSEHEYPLSPLARADAVSLFTERARALRPDFEPGDEAAQVCRRLDGLPLAIELAAAQVKVLSLRKMLERLDHVLPALIGGARDLPERQRTLMATIAWSYDLLSESDRRLFARMAVFSGGCTLEAAEAICEGDIGGLASLLDKSLLQRDGERYFMLETIHEYAAEKLEASGEADQIRRRRGSWYVALAERIEPDLYDAAAVSAARLLEMDHDNLRATLREAIDRDDAETLLRVATALGAFWHARGHLREGLEWSNQALTRYRGAPTLRVAKAHLRAGGIAERSGDLSQARSHWEASLDAAREVGDDHTVASASGNLGNLALSVGEYVDAAQRFEAATAFFSKSGDTLGVAIGMNALGAAELLQGRAARAVEFLNQSLVIARKVANHGQTASTLHNLAMARIAEGDFVAALAALDEAIRAAESAEDPALTIAVIEGFGGLNAARKRWERAARLFGFAEAFRQQSGISDPLTRQLAAPYLALLRTSMSAAELMQEWRAGQLMTIAEATAFARAD
jgi:predicted ATPase/DNA-binding SARP family transcriptional activator